MNYNDYINSLKPSDELKEKTVDRIETAVNEHNKSSARNRAVLLSAACIVLAAVSFLTVKTISQKGNKTVIKNPSTVNSDTSSPNESTTVPEESTTNITAHIQRYNSAFSYDLKQNQLSDFDIAFLKAENIMVNKVYSPLSIKFTLSMLNEGTDGPTRDQISKVLGDYVVTKYNSNDNMSFANTLFVRDSFKSGVKDSFISSLQNRYNAEVVFDPFENPVNINKWVNEKTLKLIPEMLGSVDNTNFVLVNALGIDMEWENKFFDQDNNYEKGFRTSVSYNHERYNPGSVLSGLEGDNVKHLMFDNEKLEVSGMEIFASMDNYDLVNILGEDNVRNTVETAYRNFISKKGKDAWGNPLTDPDAIEEEVSTYIEKYMEEIKANYVNQGEVKSTDFSLYADDEVKALAKDLKQYDGTTLQYISIMPVKDDLDKFIDETNAEKLNEIIGNLKEVKRENFKDGVITQINGFFPKFKFEYKLNLIDDLSRMGITDVFDSNKADLSRLTDAKGVYISEVAHKANIELSQDGIKAGAATIGGGAGGGGPIFDYIFDVPVEKIDLTFDKPFMFIIRDKNTGDVWFTGTVYEPFSWESEMVERFGEEWLNNH